MAPNFTSKRFYVYRFESKADQYLPMASNLTSTKFYPTNSLPSTSSLLYWTKFNKEKEKLIEFETWPVVVTVPRRFILV